MQTEQKTPPELSPKQRVSQPNLPGIFENIDQEHHVRQQERLIHRHAKRIVEALLFASQDPITFSKIRDIIETFHPIKPKALRELITDLQQEYLSQQRAFRLEEIADGFILRSCEEYGSFIEILHINKRTEKLSQASAEVLSIIAYRQPITRPQIEAIRGVDCSGIVQNLFERNLIEQLGKADAPGRPMLYGITQEFLKHFGLKDVKDLPELS